MAEASINFQAQAANMTQGFGESSSISSTKQAGQLDNQQIIANTEVDASTKDDECMSSFQAEKKQKKAVKKEKDKNISFKNIQASKGTQKAQERDYRSKRLTRQTEARLQLINNNSSNDLKNTIQERSNALFSGSEEKYQNCFDILEKAIAQKICNRETIENTLRTFNDVAEQHNALQIAKDVFERKLANLKDLAENLRNQEKESDEAKNDYHQLQDQIKNLEESLDNISEAQTNLMAKNGNRIADSYVLAPLIRETTAHFTHDVKLPPKDFNALLLDKILPLKGDVIQTFNCLTEGFIENLSKNELASKSAINHFKDNLSIVLTGLNQELKSCPDPQISSAIINACRSAEKLGTIQELNTQILQKTYATFSR